MTPALSMDNFAESDASTSLDSDERILPGERFGKMIDIPQGTAQRMLRSVVRLVADLPRRSSPEVVWKQGASELLVFTDSISIRCTSGVVTIGLAVACDQVEDVAKVSIPLAVGTRRVPAGLVMSTFSEVAGPPVITDVWSSAVTAFAWESLLELARQIAAAVGDDARGRPLVPGAVAATSRRLLVQPIARHESGLGV